MTEDERLIREELDRTQRLNAKLAFENERLREVMKDFVEFCEHANLTWASLWDKARTARAAMEEKVNG